MTLYLDCNATTPIEPLIQEAVIKYLAEEFGNSGSRTHNFGLRAQQAVQEARGQISRIVNAQRDEVIFTSGATESNNIAILGLTQYAESSGHKHIISSRIEHKAVLEPLEVLASRGFEIDLVTPDKSGRITPDSIKRVLREDTLLVSIMHVNNETGVIQPVQEIVWMLERHSAFLHVDAAQGFGKEIETLQNTRIDLISISGHKIYAPKGVGALVSRRRRYKRPPLMPLMYGGGQERGLRPGTLPVPLIVGLGLAAELALNNFKQRAAACMSFRRSLLSALEPLEFIINGAPESTLPHVINLSFPGVASEALMVALKDLVAVSNGSACTSQNYQPSHVLKAMGLPESQIRGAIRISWCHMTEMPKWDEIVSAIKRLQ